MASKLKQMVLQNKILKIVINLLGWKVLCKFIIRHIKKNAAVVQIFTVLLLQRLHDKSFNQQSYFQKIKK